MRLAVLAVAVLLTACGELKIRAGRHVDAALIESKLVVGRSTAAEVQRALGEPLGMGREWLPFRDRPRVVWSYYAEESQASLSGLGETRRMFVWVFLKDDRYDGYLWVSNFPEDRAAY
jgi:hypothetical protein